MNPIPLTINGSCPVTYGYSLIISKRHLASFFEASPVEPSAMFAQMVEAKIALDTQNQPAGYKLGINDGETAGQTVWPMHLISRCKEEGANKFGGVPAVERKRREFRESVV